ncbi:MAG: OmpA family protein [Pseudomonadota bacterium]|nr:OmpA family protein [Pseudomonadota bacterium]
MTILTTLLLGGCLVGKGKYDALQAELDTTRTAMTAQLAERDQKVTSLEDALAQEKAKLADLDARRTELANALASEEARTKALLDEKAGLISDKAKLKTSVEDMKAALSELEARRNTAEQRIAEYQSLLVRFKKLIDAGKLRVKIVDGRMVVALATDVLFASGSADLSPEGSAAIAEVATVLASIPDRSFQVEGHTDNVPIKTEKYPSNWELASARAVTVVRTMITAGMPTTRVSAASYGEHKPVASNDTPDGKGSNRRIEIVVVPDLSGLPGFDELKRASAN